MYSLILIFAIFLPAFDTSFCGNSAIPFTFQVLKSGFPVLGCARPKCFGWNANGTKAADSAQFYRVAGKDDGFLRISEQFVKAPSNNPNFVPQVAICRENYESDKCQEGEWVGGVAPQSDPFTDKIKMRCCSYQILLNSEDRGLASVKKGQVVVGGEVLDNGRLVAFDYISNISKSVFPNGTILYNAHVRRMPCFDETISREDSQKSESNIVEHAATVQTPQVQQPQQVPTQAQPIQQVNQQQFAAPTQTIPPYPQQQQLQQQTIEQQTNYGQFSQQGYGISQNGGQYQGYPQYPQQQQQQYQNVQYPQQQQQQQPNFYQDPLTAMLQQQQQVFQQQQQPQQMGFVQMQPFPQQINMFPQPAGVQVPVTTTVAPVTLPKLEDLPKLQIPSVEDVEQVIPPVQRAILTSVAKFFGVL